MCLTVHSALFDPDRPPAHLSLLSLRFTQSEERNIKDRSTTSTKNWQGYIGTHVIENISEATEILATFQFNGVSLTFQIYRPC